ncbi:MAG: CDP-diacylglycerol--serine O-phosphatidyltransferase [Terriglobia bacterium]
MEPPSQPPQLEDKRRGIRRGVYILPSLFTVGTLVCGYFAILSTLRGAQMVAAGVGTGLALMAFDNASKAIGWAILFDGLDGRIARLTNTASPFGREFDSLADVVAFGLAPAVLAYVWGVRSVDALAGTQLIQHLPQVAWLITFAYVICGAARLARFNIDTLKPTTDRRFFVGLPIPAAAGVVAAVVHWQKQPVSTWAVAAGWLVAVGILAFLMVSRMRYYSFKTLDLRKRRSYLVLILIGLIIWGVFFYSEPVLLTLALTYALSGILLRISSKFRPHPPAPEEVHAA